MEAARTQSGPWSIGRLLTWTRDYLQERSIESPRLCAEILLAHALGCERIKLYTQYEAEPGPDVLDRFRASVREAAAGQPIAYLTGTKEFFSLPFEVNPDVLIPRPETEILVERTIDLVRHSGGSLRSILDLGTGSGCIAVSLARHLPDVRVFASDVLDAALAVARRNAERHGVAERIRFARGDLFEPWRDMPATGAAPFDVIVCNPPYLATAPGTPLDRAVRCEPAVAVFAGTDGLDIIRRVVATAPRWLTAGGHLLLEMAFDQATALRALLDRQYWEDIVTYRDGASHERVVQARCGRAAQVQVA